MGFFGHERSNVDPFNAGDPVMPWDEPQAVEDPGSAVDEPQPQGEKRGYQAPTKQQDDYEPQAREERAPVENTRRAGKSPNPKRLVIGIIVGVTALSLLVGFIGAAVSIVEDLVSDVTGSASYLDDSTDSYDAGPSVVIDEEAEQEIQELAQAKLDAALADTDGMNARYIKVLNQRIESSLGRNADELGLDTETFCTWMDERVSMEITGVYCYEDGTAGIYIDSAYPALYRLNDSFTGQASSYLANQDDESLSDSQKARINKLFMRALGDIDDTTSTVRLEATEVDGTWTIDDEDFNTVINQLLGDYEE